VGKLKLGVVQTSFHHTAFTPCQRLINSCQRPMTAEMEAQPLQTPCSLPIVCVSSVTWAVSKHADSRVLLNPDIHTVFSQETGDLETVGWVGAPAVGCVPRVVPSHSLSDPVCRCSLRAQSYEGARAGLLLFCGRLDCFLRSDFRHAVAYHPLELRERLGEPGTQEILSTKQQPGSCAETPCLPSRTARP